MTADGGAIVVYTDGACSGNPGPGGWAWAESPERSDSGGSVDTTNNRMELLAVLEAIRANPGPLHVVTDSTYVKHGIEQWSHAWERNGWKTKDRKDVKNRDLWEPLVHAVRARSDLTFGWVKGHSGDRMNDLVDELACRQRDAHRPGGTPLAPLADGSTAAPLRALSPDEQRAERRRRDSRIPDGHLLAVFGHQPPELGGWDANPTADDVRRRLREILEAKHQLHPDLVVLSGLRLGAELPGAEAAVGADVPFVAVLPYPEPEKRWPPAAQARFRDLAARAKGVVTLERKQPVDGAAAAKALARRDAWLARAADEAVLVWDGDDPRLARLQRTLDEQLGPDLWVLEP
ncbi:MAG: Ribonuclease [Acidimicrobiales bacterium]|nr:Ribonuclease [Acidimicrobiales bacterium]